jgi:NNMT/PNMT/TEMT family
MPSRPDDAIAKAAESSAHAGLFDFREVANFPRDYLATYYCQPPTTDEQMVLAFLAEHFPKIESQPCAIEIGCGPTVHHVLPLAPYVSAIHMADYLPENLDEVRRWRDREPDAHQWEEYTALTLDLEGRPKGPADIERRERDVRRKMTRFLVCDLKSDVPLGTPRQYAAVCSFYCGENIGITRDEWLKVMQRLANLTQPGGFLFLSALRETTYYVVRSSDGSSQRLPSAYLTERNFAEVLPQLGFAIHDMVIDSRGLTGQEDEGVNGVILVAARKA